MVIAEAKTALRRHLVNAFPNIDIAVEGIPFDAQHGTYLAVQFVIRSPIEPTYGPYYYREDIQMHIFVSDRLGIGTTNAENLADQIREVFYKGLTIVEGNYRIQILRRAHLQSAVVTSDRLVVPISLPFQVEVYRNS